MSLINISKIRSEKSISDTHIPVFIDCSGSTSTNTRSGKNIFTHEEEFAKDFKHTNIYWDTSVRLHCNGPCGGTEPKCIFDDESSKNMIENSDIIMLLTDGEIYQKSVTEFSNKLNKYLNKALYVCVIFGRERKDLFNLNISVIAPMMLAANCLCLYHDGDNCRTYVIASKGSITKLYRNPSSSSDIQEFKMNDLRDFKYETTHIPSGYIVISETIDYYRVIKTDDLLNEDNLLTLSETEFETVIKHCVVTNTLDKLRSIISKLRNKFEYVSQKIRDKFTFKYTKIRDSIIEDMVRAYDAEIILKNNIN